MVNVIAARSLVSTPLLDCYLLFVVVAIVILTILLPGRLSQILISRAPTPPLLFSFPLPPVPHWLLQCSNISSRHCA